MQLDAIFILIFIVGLVIGQLIGAWVMRDKMITKFRKSYPVKNVKYHIKKCQEHPTPYNVHQAKKAYQIIAHYVLKI